MFCLRVEISEYEFYSCPLFIHSFIEIKNGYWSETKLLPWNLHNVEKSLWKNTISWILCSVHPSSIFVSMKNSRPICAFCWIGLASWMAHALPFFVRYPFSREILVNAACSYSLLFDSRADFDDLLGATSSSRPPSGNHYHQSQPSC